MRYWRDDFSKRMHFSAGDLALIAGCGIIGIVIGAWYWVLVLILVYRKAYRMGVNTTFWILAALVSNLAPLAALSLYAMLKGTCTNCGRVKTGSGRFCDIAAVPYPLQMLGGLRYGKANGEKEDFYKQRTDGFGNAFYFPDHQCGCHKSIF